MTRPPAVVIGDMDLVRPLGLAGIRSVAAGPTRQEAAWSRYAIGSIRLPELWHSAEQAVEALVQYGSTRNDRPTIIYQKDPAVLLLSRHRERLSPHFRLMLPDPETVEDLIDKERFQARSAALDLPVPRALFLKPSTSGLDATTQLRFPVIVKPTVRDQTESAWRPVSHGAKALLCASVNDVARLWRRHELADVTLAVQEYIPGDETRLVSYHSFRTDDGTTIGEFTGRKVRTLPSEFGQSTAVEITADDRMRDLGRRVLDALDFHGVAKVDAKMADDGSLHVLEVNPRFNLWHHPGAVAGVNLPAAVHRYLVDGDTTQLPPATPGVRWVQVWGDARSARRAGVSPVAWTRSATTAGARRAAHLNDPGAALGALAWAATKRRGPTPEL